MDNFTSRTITGFIMMFFGVILIIISFFLSNFLEIWSVSLIYGIPIFILGFIIFFNNKEDKIERIKSRGGKKRK